jgi:methyl-accepting chemotaxis protein
MTNRAMPTASGSSIQRTLQRALVATAGAALLLASMAFIAMGTINDQSSADEQLSVLAQVVALYSEAALEFNDPAAGAEALSAFQSIPAIESALLLDSHGAVFATHGAGATSLTRLAIQRPPGVTHEGMLATSVDFVAPIIVDGQPLGRLFIRRSTSDIFQAILGKTVVVGVIMLAAMGLAIVMANRLRRHIATPLAELAGSAEAMAEGDLRHRVSEKSMDEIGVLARSFNGMTRGLRDLVLVVRQGIADVGEVARALSERAKGLAEAATRQSHAISEATSSVDRVAHSIRDVNANVELLAETAEETSSSILEMDASIGEIASHMDELTGAIETTSNAVGQVTDNLHSVAGSVLELDQTTTGATERFRELAASVAGIEVNAAESRALSEDSSREASEGMAAMRETIEAMNEISSSFGSLQDSVARLAKKSQSIDEIVQVIQDVAEQTGLLSLNAAIIAAQAGEHGRAFSVVAEQVNELADRTHRSTREIADLIRTVQGDTSAAVTAVAEGSARVETGVKRSNMAGQFLDRILEKTDATTRRVRDIADATSQQSQDLERLEDAMRAVEASVKGISQSSSEQDIATREIARSIENIRNLGVAVKHSTEEQRRGSGLITKAASQVSEMVSQIAEATSEQARSGENIERMLRIFGGVSEETRLGAEAISKNVATLIERSVHLENEAGRFKIDRDA